MTTIEDIHAVERLMQTLDENPHLLEAVRSRVLTRELLELPQKHAQLTERVDQIAEQLAQLTERVDRLTERVDQIAEQLAQLTERVAWLTERVDTLVLAIGRLQNDFGQFRAEVAAKAAVKNAAVIAGDVGLIRTGNLSQDELMAMTRAADTSDISRNELRSFHLADLVIEAVDSDNRRHYVAVEASYTADRRDTRRAIRNAHYLTRFTGHPAHAVVVAMRVDREIDPQIASGEVHWYQVEDRYGDQP